MVTALPAGSSDASPVDPVLSRRVVRRRALGAVARVVATTGTLIAVYVLAPIGQRPVGAIAARLMLALLVILVVLGWQIRSVTRSPHPTLRGVEAVAVSVPLLVLTYASAYFATDSASPGGFSEALSRLDAAYFAVTVLTTVGFGDIAPQSAAARALVLSQMIVNMVLVSLVAKVLVGAVRRRRDALGHMPG